MAIPDAHRDSVLLFTLCYYRYRSITEATDGYAGVWPAEAIQRVSASASWFEAWLGQLPGLSFQTFMESWRDIAASILEQCFASKNGLTTWTTGISIGTTSEISFSGLCVHASRLMMVLVYFSLCQYVLASVYWSKKDTAVFRHRSAVRRLD